MKPWGKGEMVAGAFHKLVIEEVSLLTPEVWQGLRLLLGVMADGGMWPFTINLLMCLRGEAT